jgi:hypothetical protein
MKTLIFPLAVALFLFPIYAFTTEIVEISIPITEFAVISPPGNPLDRTVLVNISLPDSLSNKKILHAEIIANVSPMVNTDTTFEVAVIPIGIPWNPDTVQWNNAWQELGGNLEDSSITFCGINIASGITPKIEITDMVQRWLDETRSNNGIALKTPLDARVRFAVIPLNPNELASLRVLFYTDN